MNWWEWTLLRSSRRWRMIQIMLEIHANVDNKMVESMSGDMSAYACNTEGKNDDESNGSSAGTSSSSQGWTYPFGNTAPAISISVESIDHSLLDKACQEVPTVHGNINGKSLPVNGIVLWARLDFLHALMDPHLVLGYLKAFINTNENDPVSRSSDAVIAFIHVELILSF